MEGFANLVSRAAEPFNTLIRAVLFKVFWLQAAKQPVGFKRNLHVAAPGVEFETIVPEIVETPAMQEAWRHIRGFRSLVTRAQENRKREREREKMRE